MTDGPKVVPKERFFGSLEAFMGTDSAIGGSLGSLDSLGVFLVAVWLSDIGCEVELSEVSQRVDAGGRDALYQLYIEKCVSNAIER